MASRKIVALAIIAALAAAFALSGCVTVQTGANSSSSSAASASASAASTASGSSSAAASTSASASSATASSAASAPASSAAAQESYIGNQAAIDIALKDAGFSSVDVTEVKSELDLDDVVAHYDVKFEFGDKEYKYEIDATTGEILYSKSEVDD